MADMKCAVVSTVRFPEFGCGVVRSFAGYHLAKGFSHVFLFFDDENDAGIQIVKSNFNASQVTVILPDSTIKTSWRMCPSYPTLKHYVKTQVHARQRLNCEVALNIALKQGIQWLLHIDSDELFYTPEPSVQEHFCNLERSNICQMTYLNHEGVPEAEPTDSTGVDYFFETTLFRKHHSTVKMSSAASECMSFWEERRTHGQYFLAYDIGKSADRVTQGVSTVNVHKFFVPESKENRKSCTAILDPRHLALENYHNLQYPCILHFVVCGFPWLQSKYKMLGRFPDAWYEGKVPIAPSFHLEARDIVLDKNNNAVLKLYLDQVMLSSSSGMKNKMLESGVCERITGHADILKSLYGKPLWVGKTLEQNLGAEGLASGSNRTEEDVSKAPIDEKSHTQDAARKVVPKTRPGQDAAKKGTTPTMTYEKAWVIAASINKFLK